MLADARKPLILFRVIMWTPAWGTIGRSRIVEEEWAVMRINIESVFDHFDEQLSAAMAKALLDTVPGMTPKTALRAYRTFRRNALAALSPWESVPSELVVETGTGAPNGQADGLALPGRPSRERG
jgi:hypothetical protein